MYVLTAPTLEVVTLAELQQAARRVTADGFDTLMPAQAVSALSIAEQYCNRAFAQQVWRFEAAQWEELKDGLHAPAATAAAISYWTGAAWQSLTSPAPVWWQDGARVFLAPALNTEWPTLGDVAGGWRVRVDVTCGAASASSVPRGVKDFILAHVALWADRGEAASDKPLTEAPWLTALLDPHKAY